MHLHRHHMLCHRSQAACTCCKTKAGVSMQRIANSSNSFALEEEVPLQTCGPCLEEEPREASCDSNGDVASKHLHVVPGMRMTWQRLWRRSRRLAGKMLNRPHSARSSEVRSHCIGKGQWAGVPATTVRR